MTPHRGLATTTFSPARWVGSPSFWTLRLVSRLLRRLGRLCDDKARHQSSLCKPAQLRQCTPACGVSVVAVIGTVLLIVNVAFGVGWISDAWPFACFRRLIFRSVRDVIG